MILRIFKNILNNPNNARYHKLFYKQTVDKINNNQFFINILLQSGFFISSNKEKFIFDIKKLHKLKEMNSFLLQMSSNMKNQLNRPQNKHGINLSHSSQQSPQVM